MADTKINSADASAQLPIEQATDILGSQTPASLSASQETDKLPLTSPGLDAMTAGAALRPGSFAAKLFTAADKSVKDANAAGVPSKPGDWARHLIAGVSSAWSGADALGDAAAVGTVPRGSGALAGVNRTMAAHAARLRQQRQDVEESKKNAALIAETQARAYHTRLLDQLSGEDHLRNVGKEGQANIELQTHQDMPANVIISGKTDQELMDILKQPGAAKRYGLNENAPLSTQTVIIPDGVRQEGRNDDGTPRMVQTSSLITPPKEMILDPNNPDHKEAISLLNTYNPRKTGKYGEKADGTPAAETIPGDVYNHAMAQARTTRGLEVERKRIGVQEGIELEGAKFREDDHDFAAALALAKKLSGNSDDISNVMAAKSLIENTPGLGKPDAQGKMKYQHLRDDIREWLGTDKKTGEYAYDSLEQGYIKRLEAGYGELSDTRKKLEGVSSAPEASGIAADMQSRLDTGRVPLDQIGQVRDLVREANAKSKAMVDTAVDLKKREAEAEQSASEGDLSILRGEALNYEIDPNQFFSKFKGLAAKQKFVADMRRQEQAEFPNRPESEMWSEANYKKRYMTKQDFRAEGRGGQMVQSLNYFAGHLDDANSLISGLQNTSSPLLNVPVNAWKKDVLGQPQVIKYKVGITAVANEYLRFLTGNHALHDEDEKDAAELKSFNMSPAAAQDMMRQMANTIQIRAREMNDRYFSDMKTDIPDYLEPETQQIFRNFGIDPNSILHGRSAVKQPTTEEKAKLPPVAKGMFRAQIPGGKIMDFPESQRKTVTENGGVVQ